MPNYTWHRIAADEPETESKEERLYARRVQGKWDYRVWIGSTFPLSCGYTHVADIEPPEVSDDAQ